MAKLLTATLGSLGDVRPLLAMALAAERRGHRVTFATSAGFAPLVRAYGIKFASLGSDAYFDDPSTRSGLVDPRTGFALFMALSNLQNIETMFARLDDLARGKDAIISTPLVMAAHLVAQKRRLPLVNCALSPAMLLADWGGSTIDTHAREWRHRLNALRADLGLPRRSFPQMERFAADLTLGAYPRCITGAEAPFIRTPLEIGYPSLYDLGEDSDCPSECLLEWMRAGPFVLLSFGSFVDDRAIHMFECARDACAALGLRLLFVSKYRAKELAHWQGADIRIESYLSHRAVMRRAAVVVHHCGVGTLAAAVEACRPMVAVPFGLDQSFNAGMLAKRNLAHVLPSSAFGQERLQGVLQQSLDSWAERASLWRLWREDEGNLSAQRAIEHVESLI